MRRRKDTTFASREAEGEGGMVSYGGGGMGPDCDD